MLEVDRKKQFFRALSKPLPNIDFQPGKNGVTSTNLFIYRYNTALAYGHGLKGGKNKWTPIGQAMKKIHLLWPCHETGIKISPLT